jgi:ribosomal protein L11 methyltransferase
MKKVRQSSRSYSVIEIALCGRGLRPREKAEACDFLVAYRIPGHDLVITDYKGVFRACCYTRDPQKARALRKKYQALGRRSYELRIKGLGRHDWFDKWKRDYHIRPLSSKFMIVPEWERRKFRPGFRMPVYLEPGSAFGSGYHETTRLMIRLLESLSGKIGSFLDIGCGTGILSVVAFKLGARKITGYDNDKPSALVAGKNFRNNLCANGRFFCAQLKRSGLSGQFDTVGANLLSKALLEHRERIMARVRPGGHLLVSGIALQNLPSFRRGFSGVPFRCLRTLRGRGWAAVLFQRSAV